MANYSSENVESSLTLYSGDTAKSMNVLGGGQLIVNGGIASQTNVQNNGIVAVIGGGSMNVVNASGGFVNVLSGGNASNTVLTNNAYMDVLAGGAANTVCVSDGTLSVSSGGAVSSVQIGNAGALKMLKGGKASAVTVSAGGTAGDFKQLSGSAVIAAMDGKAFAGTVTGLNAIGNLSAVTGAKISGGSFASGSLQLSGNASVSGVKIGDSGVLNVSSSANSVVNTVIAAGGTLTLNGNATASNVTIHNGGTLNGFTHVGASATSVSAVSGSVITGTASNVVFDGTMRAGNGAKLSNITVNDGALFLSAGANVSGLTVNGLADIRTGASASGITVKNGGVLKVAKDSTVKNLTLATGAQALDFIQKGTAAATIETITSEGIGGAISNLDITGDVQILSKGKVTSLIVEEDGNATVNNGAFVSAATVKDDGTIIVKEGGTVQNTAVLAGGRLNVSSGGSAAAVTLYNGGLIDMVIRGGDTKTYVAGKNDIGAFSYINGVASNFMVYAGQNFVISSGGSARNVRIAKGGVLSAALGADVTGYSADMNMNFSILGGAVSGLTNLSNFELGVGFGYSIDGQRLSNGGVQTVTSGGLVKRTQINSGGEVRIGNNGSAWDIVQAKGGKVSVDVYHSAALTSVTGSRLLDDGGLAKFSLEKGVARNFLISSGATMTLHSGGSAVDTTVAANGRLVLSSGGTASQVALEKGAIVSAGVYKDTNTAFSAKYDGSVDVSLQNGVATNFVLENGGRLDVYAGATANNITVNDDGLLYVDYQGAATKLNIEEGGEVFVESGGRVSDVTIHNGGTLTLSSKTTLNGSVTVSGTLVLDGAITFNGEVISIDLAGLSVGTTPRIENISFIPDATYAVTIDAVTPGNYVLATGALDFSDSIMIYDQNSGYLGTLDTENNYLQSKSCGISLVEKSNGDLILNVDDSVGIKGVNVTVGNFGNSEGVFEWTDDGRCLVYSASGEVEEVGNLSRDEWTLLGSGDFDGDDIDEMLWLENATCNAYIQDDINDFSDVSNKVNCLGNVGGYSNIAFGDFADDGKESLLIKGPAFVDDGTVSYDLTAMGAGNTPQYLASLVKTWQFGQELVGNTAAEISAKNYMYDVAAVGDFNGDGIDDVLVRNNMPASVAGKDIVGSGDLFTFLSTDERKISYAGNLIDNWDIFGAGDFNGDGTDDILFSNGSVVKALAMSDGTSIDELTFGTLSSIEKIAGIGDFNNDKTDDILIRNSSTGEFTVWMMNEGVVSSKISLA